MDGGGKMWTRSKGKKEKDTHAYGGLAPNGIYGTIDQDLHTNIEKFEILLEIVQISSSAVFTWKG